MLHARVPLKFSRYQVLNCLWCMAPGGASVSALFPELIQPALSSVSVYHDFLINLSMLVLMY